MEAKMKTEDAIKITNALEAEIYTRDKCRLILGRHDSDWCRSFFAQNFPMLVDCQMGRILMGWQAPPQNRPYYYTPSPF